MTAVWRDASFRGAAFYVETFERSGGRRGPNHEFPFKDQGYPEDMGKKMETFSIDAYAATNVSDQDYASRRDALITALNERGPGDLVHPAFGTMQVQLREWRERESKSRLGMAVFTLTFVESDSAAYPSAHTNIAAGMPGLAGSGHTSAAGAFGSSFSIAGKSDFLIGAAREILELVADTYSLAGSMSGVSVDSHALCSAAVAALDAAALGKDTAVLAAAIAEFARTVTGHFEERHKSTRNADGTYRGLTDLHGNGPLEEEAATALFRLIDFESGMAAPIRMTTTRQIQYGNAEALAAYVRQTAAIEAARVAPFINWQHLQVAEEARDRIADALEREAWATTDDDLYRALSDIRTLLLQTMAPDKGRLPLLMEYGTPMTMPSLALSHQLYGTAARADELVTLNGLRHPGFFPGGETVRILSNA